MGTMTHVGGPLAPAGHRIKKEYEHLPVSARMFGMMFHGKGAKGPLGNMFERIPESIPRSYAFDSPYQASNFNIPDVPNVPNVPSGNIKPRESLLSDWEANTSVPQYDSSLRDSMRMNVPTQRQGVTGIFNKNLKGAVKKNRRTPAVSGSDPFNRAGNKGLNV